MTITSILNTFETTANTTDKSYTFNQPIHKASDLVVYIAGLIKLTNDGTYPHTVTVAANKQSATVLFTTAPGVVALKFERTVAYKQETDLANNSLFDAESLETTLDNIVMQTQQAGFKAAAAFGFDPGIAADDYDDGITAASILNKDKDARKGKTLIFHLTTGDIDVSALSVDEITTSVNAAAQSATDATTNGAAQVTLAAAQVSLATAQVALANTAKGDAEAAEAAAELILDNFDDRYLGTKSADPTLDNDSNALVDGAIYYNTTSDYIKVYDSSLTPKWRQITPTIANQTNIDILTSKYDGSTTAGSGTNLNIAQVNTVALNLANVDNFADLYQIDDFTTVPTKDGGGVDNLAKGDLAFDTTLNALRVYNGTAWSSGVNTTDGVIVKQEYTGNGSNTHFALAHDQGMEIVYLNGVKLLAGNGSSNNDFFSVSGGSSTTYVGNGNAATHIYFHTAPANTYVVSFVAWGASANSLAISSSGGTYSGVVTLPSPVINTGVSGTAILDSDTMSGTSATTLSSSESIKAYVDSNPGSPSAITPTDSSTFLINSHNTKAIQSYDGAISFYDAEKTGGILRSTITDISWDSGNTTNCTAITVTGSGSGAVCRINYSPFFADFRIGSVGSGYKVGDTFHIENKLTGVITSVVGGDLLGINPNNQTLTSNGMKSISIANNLLVTGSIQKGSGSFKIDHPLSSMKDTHNLVHSFVESPKADLIYRGVVTLANGCATVDLDTASGMTTGTWVLLCRDEQVFTSNETGWSSVKGSVSGVILNIECENPNSTDTISWMIVAERQDSHMYDTTWTDENGRPIVEPIKNE